MKIKVILTGATGMVGEGILMECLQNPAIEKVLMINRRPLEAKHHKLQELIIADFMDLDKVTADLAGYDACFFCAGISSAGMKEPEYMHITYDVTMHFAKILVKVNPDMIFNFVSGSHTDSSEKGSIMWARVKGKTENALFKLPFKKVYAFRPGFMKPTDGQKNVKAYYKVIASLYPALRFIFPNNISTMRAVALAMINAVLEGYDKQILEIKDMKALARIQ